MGEPGEYAAYSEDRVRGGSQQSFRGQGNSVAPGYFAATENPLVRGREFEPGEVGSSERAGELPVIVTAALARRLWPGVDPLGRRLQSASDSGTGPTTLVVTGVTADAARGVNPRGEASTIYFPSDTSIVYRNWLIRTSGGAEARLPMVRGIVREEVPNMVARLQTVSEIEDQQRRTFAVAAGSLLGVGVLVLLLCGIGLYAVIAFSVGQRVREIAVRKAVGAPGGRIARKFVSDGTRLGVYGLALGLPISLMTLLAINSIPDSGIPRAALGPVALVVAVGVLGVAAAASWLPARRAASVDAAEALRRD